MIFQRKSVSPKKTSFKRNAPDSFLQEVLTPSKPIYKLDIMSFGQEKLVSEFDNCYSRYSYNGLRMERRKLKKPMRKMSSKRSGEKEEIKVVSDSFLSLKISSRSSVNFDLFDKIEKEILPVRETKASMGRKKIIARNSYK